MQRFHGAENNIVLILDHEAQQDRRPFFTGEKVTRMLSLLEDLDRHMSGSGLVEMNPVSIGVVGDTSSGKTTLINSILGTNALPTHVDACTGFNVNVHIVKKGTQKSKYTLEFPKPDVRNLWDPLGLFSSAQAPEVAELGHPAEVWARLHSEFKGYIGPGQEPDFSRYCKLIVEDNRALQLAITDTPGLRASEHVAVTNEKWARSIMMLSKSSHLILMVTLKYKQGEMHYVTQSTFLEKKQSGSIRLDNITLIFVITHMDLYPCNTSDPTFETNLEQFTRMYSPKVIALVQCIGSEGTYDSAEEIATLQRVPRALQEKYRLCMGMSSLTDYVVKLYLKMWGYPTLSRISTSLEQKITDTKTLLARKKLTIVPSREVVTVVQTSKEQYPLLLQMAEDLLRQQISDVLCSFKKPIPAVFQRCPHKPGDMGMSAADIARADEASARSFVQDFYGYLSQSVATILGGQQNLYETTLQSQIACYGDNSPRFSQSILECWNTFQIQNSGAAIDEIVLWVERYKLMTNLRPNPQGPSFTLPNTFVPLHNKNPVAVKSCEILSRTLQPLVWTIMGILVDRIHTKFEVALLSHFSGQNEPLWSASPEEIAVIQTTLEELKHSQSKVCDLIAECNKGD
ncbi:hypothetical protein Pelo_2296 [Pelomyxa schiedti]|nr:hypothetical protein Pelo_2296 [Pelomyxa schiedti]